GAMGRRADAADQQAVGAGRGLREIEPAPALRARGAARCVGAGGLLRAEVAADARAAAARLCADGRHRLARQHAAGADAAAGDVRLLRAERGARPGGGYWAARDLRYTP